MYILLAGLIIGLAMCPWIMGRFMSVESFQKWYLGGAKEFDAYVEFQKEQNIHIGKEKLDKEAKLKATGVTEIAIKEAMDAIDEAARLERVRYPEAVNAARQEHLRWLISFVSALVIATALVMFIEPIFEPRGRTAVIRRRLVTARYVLIAAWVATSLAKPAYLTSLSPLFVFLLVTVAILAAIVPWLMAGKE